MKYKFVGDGMGIPGLPHEISDEQAEQMGVQDLLKAAIENGNYVEEVSRPSTSLRTDVKNKEVKHGQ